MFTSNMSALILEMIIMHNWQRGDQMCFCQAGTMVKAMRAVIFVTQLQFLRIPLLMKAMCHHSYKKMEKHIKRETKAAPAHSEHTGLSGLDCRKQNWVCCHRVYQTSNC